MRGLARRLTSFASAAAIAAAVAAVPSAVADEPAPKPALNGKERRAIQIRSVKISGDESLGILVTAKFGGNITDVIGRKHLRKASAELILRPVSSDFAPARIVTKRAGLIGRTVAKTSSKKVGVVRDGRTLTFFNFGPGYSNVATAEVRVHAPAGAGQAIASRDETSGQVPVPQGTPSRADLTRELDKVEEALKTAQAAKAKAESLLKSVENLLKDLDSGFLINKVASLIQKFEDWRYKLKRPTSEAAVANLKKSREDLKKQINEVNATIDDLEAQQEKIKDKLRNSPPQPAAPTGTGRLARSGSDCASNPSCPALDVFVKSDQPLSGFTVVVASGYIVAGGGVYLPDGTQIGQCTFGTTNTQYDTLTCGFTEQPAGTEVRAQTSVSTQDGSSRYPAGTGARGQLTNPGRSANFTLTGP